MKAHELFGVALRVIGVWEVVQGLVQIPTWMATYRQFARLPTPMVSQAVRQIAFLSGTQVVVGIVLFLCANWIVRLAYGYRGDELTPDGPQPLPAIPRHVKLPLLVTAAIGVSSIYTWLSNKIAIGPRTSFLSGLHTILLLAIGCLALAFLFRKRHDPVEFFLQAWIAATVLGILVILGH